MRIEQDPIRRVPGPRPTRLDEALLERASLGQPRIRLPHSWRNRVYAELLTLRRLFARAGR